MASSPANYTPRQQQPTSGGGQAQAGGGDAPRAHTQYGLTLPGRGDEVLALLRTAAEQAKDYCGAVVRHRETADAFLQGAPMDLHEKAGSSAQMLEGESDDFIAKFQQLVEEVREAVTHEAQFMAATYEAADSTAAGLKPVPTVGALREG